MPITKKRAHEAISEAMKRASSSAEQGELGGLRAFLSQLPEESLEHVPDDDPNAAIVGFLKAGSLACCCFCPLPTCSLRTTTLNSCCP